MEEIADFHSECSQVIPSKNKLLFFQTFDFILYGQAGKTLIKCNISPGSSLFANKLSRDFRTLVKSA